MYNCTVNADAHTWTISSRDPHDSEILTIDKTDTVIESPPYTVKTLSDDGNQTITTLNLTVFDGFGGTNISCIDSDAPPGIAEFQNITATVFGECLYDASY